MCPAACQAKPRGEESVEPPSCCCLLLWVHSDNGRQMSVRTFYHLFSHLGFGSWRESSWGIRSASWNCERVKKWGQKQDFEKWEVRVPSTSRDNDALVYNHFFIDVNTLKWANYILNLMSVTQFLTPWATSAHPLTRQQGPDLMIHRWNNFLHRTRNDAMT